MNRALALLVAAAAAAGCDDHAPPPRPPREPPSRPVALRPATRASDEPRPTEAPSAAPDDPLGRCVRRNREALGPELGRALAALQDDALLEDACGLDLAVRARAPERCAALRLSSLRESCLFRAAVAAGRPEACPPAPGLRGRDPVCVALAARDPSLCGAAAFTERARCLALAAHDPRRCDALDPLLRPACTRDLDAVAEAFPAMARAAAASPDPGRNVWSTAVDDAGVDDPVAWLTRGVFLDETGALWLVDAARGWPADGAIAFDQGLVGVVAVARRGTAPAVEARLVAPGGAAFATADGSVRATVTLARAARRRGDRVVGSVAFEGARPTVLRFDTFVRDVVAAAALR